LLAAYETEVSAGGVLVIREKPAAGRPPGSGQEQARLNLFVLCGQVRPGQPGAVSRALGGLLGLDSATGRLRPPGPTDARCGCGRPAWLSRKPRPKDYFQRLGTRVAGTEWRGVFLAWSLDCIEHSRFIPASAAADQKAMEARYDRDAAHAIFHVIAAKGLEIDKVQARVAAGPDLASALTHPGLLRGLAVRLKADLPGKEVSFWAPAVNVVVVTVKPLEGDLREEFRRSALAIAREAGVEPGETLDVEVRQRMTAEPAGSFGPPPGARDGEGDAATRRRGDAGRGGRDARCEAT